MFGEVLGPLRDAAWQLCSQADLWCEGHDKDGCLHTPSALYPTTSLGDRAASQSPGSPALKTPGRFCLSPWEAKSHVTSYNQSGPHAVVKFKLATWRAQVRDVSISCDFCNKFPHTLWLNLTEFNFLLIWKPEVSNQDVGRSCLFWMPLREAGSCLC